MKFYHSWSLPVKSPSDHSWKNPSPMLRTAGDALIRLNNFEALGKGQRFLVKR